MPAVKKFVIGIRPATKMFRMPGLSGAVVDALMAARGNKPLSDDYFSEVAQNPEQNVVSIRSDPKETELRLTHSDIIFLKDYYPTGKKFSFDDILSEFRAVWGITNEIVEVKDIRRIGIAVEFRFDSRTSNPSEELLKGLTGLACNGYPDKFHLRFEQRSFEKNGGIPDRDKGDFYNVITDYYDATMDADHPAEKAFNANIDVQHYFAPLLNRHVVDEVLKLRKIVDDESQRFVDSLRKMGLINGKP